MPDTLPARLVQAALLLADSGDMPTARMLTRAAARVLERRAGFTFAPDSDPVAVVATLALNGDAGAQAVHRSPDWLPLAVGHYCR